MWIRGAAKGWSRATTAIVIAVTSVAPAVPPLPLSALLPQGLPGCNLHVVPDILQAMFEVLETQRMIEADAQVTRVPPDSVMLNAMAAKVYKLGDCAGAGSKVKIINQLLAGVHIAAAAEAMALGLREGVNPNDLYEVITHSAGNSWMFENRMAHVLAGDYTPWSAVDIFVKDLGLVLDMARASKFPLPLSSTAHQMFMQASTGGHATEDDSAVIKIFPGITLPSKA